ncbi:response regulator receiver modulated diguanylate cyclase/phosphodiesterase [Chondrocystis sp. NIES-4102]|nr:response regulator receiver modulated diguanylate cyclase/phosphodiesterase [Chondrocystis sp. NIES-4102]
MSNYQFNSDSGTILIVDDVADNLRVLSTSLTQRGYQVRCAINGTMALIAAKKDPPQLILLDIKMPDIDGYQVCQQLKADELTRNIPIIFLSALDDVIDKVKAFAVGGVDYITKPFQAEEVVSRIQHQLDLQAAKTEIDKLNTQLEQTVKKRTAQLEAVIQQLNAEIAQHQHTQHQLSHQALHDALTGLPNRTLFMEHLTKAIQRHQRNPHYLFAVLFIDLDRFKIINDSWGHLVGDQLLVAVAGILKECCRDLDTVARLSGDEFTILLEDLQDFQDAIAVAERLLDRLSAPIHLDKRRVFSGASIGIVYSSIYYKNGIELLRDADTAMYRAKELGKGRYAVFDREMYDQTIHLSQLETDLRLALDRQEFVLHYQPIVSLTTSKLIGFEALLRWQHPRIGLITPEEFINIAEDTGLIIPLGEWVLKEACQQLSAWQSTFPMASALHISVNLSCKQIKQLDFVEKLEQILITTGLNRNSLRLELTETMLMDRAEKTIELLSQIKQQKVQLSIDDFGTGYSSLSYLHRFPVDTLKIDRSFVNLINTKNSNYEIVKTIITLAHSLGMKAIAEGVETPHQITLLTKLGCEAAQGYFFAKPLDKPLAESIILNNPQW